MRASKRLLRCARVDAVQETIAAESEVFAARLRTLEAQEAFTAFFEKRKLDFSKF